MQEQALGQVPEPELRSAQMLEPVPEQEQRLALEPALAEWLALVPAELLEQVQRPHPMKVGLDQPSWLPGS